ncbi:TPA: hypothetical protein GRR49_25940, partial [Vibrio parahaemolyticus]|nr:hypothetical protein [Vibrio parahaemolyticus]
LVNGTVYHVHNDHLGTPQALTDELGEVVWKAQYTPFGRASVTTELVTFNLRFPGQYFDTETGLHYNWHRYYDPSLGRYLQSDRLGLFDGMDTYGYVRGNPLSSIDPTGEFAWGVVFAGIDLAYQLYDNGGKIDCVNWGDVGLAALGGGMFNAVKVAKVHRFKSAVTTKGNPHSWGATRRWYAKNINKDIPPRQHIHHWLVERRHFEGNQKLERIFNQPWNLNPKPFTNIYHNTKIHNNGIKGWFNGVPIWARETVAGLGLTAAGGNGCGCSEK